MQKDNDIRLTMDIIVGLVVACMILWLFFG
jgi:hypothetical protein